MPTDSDIVLRSRLRYHLRCLQEDATNPELFQLERLALVRDRVRRIREVRGELAQCEVTGVCSVRLPGDRIQPTAIPLDSRRRCAGYSTVTQGGAIAARPGKVNAPALTSRRQR